MEHRIDSNQRETPPKDLPVDEAAERDEAEVQAALEELEERTARQEELLDEGVEETFPASDPVSVKRIT